MATGDQNDILARLKSLLPGGWFQGNTPILDGLLSGAASLGAWAYDLITYVRLQTRIGTATDGWLDIISFDFFGTTLPRKNNSETIESDANFRARILANVLPERVTRQALIDLITRLTGIPPLVNELWRPWDTGAWKLLGGWSVFGAWTSLAPQAYQAFVTIFLKPQGIPWRAGWKTPAGGWNKGAGGSGCLIWGALQDMPGYVSEVDLFAAINSVRPFGTRIWANIHLNVIPTPPPPPPFPPQPAYIGGWGVSHGFSLFAWSTPSAGAWQP